MLLIPDVLGAQLEELWYVEDDRTHDDPHHVVPGGKQRDDINEDCRLLQKC